MITGLFVRSLDIHCFKEEEHIYRERQEKPKFQVRPYKFDWRYFQIGICYKGARGKQSLFFNSTYGNECLVLLLLQSVNLPAPDN